MANDATEAGNATDAGDATASGETLDAWTARVCKETTLETIVAVATPNPVEIDCYLNPACGEPHVLVRVANCGTVARAMSASEPFVTDGRETRAWEFEPIPAKAAAILPIPVFQTGIHRYLLSGVAEGRPASSAEVTADVRDPGFERAQKEHCDDLSAAGVLDAGPPPPPRDGVELKLTRSGCFGPCPAYSLILRSDGSVIYEGIHDVRVQRRVIDVIAPAVVATLLASFDRAVSEPLGRLAPGGHCVRSADAPRTSVTVLRNGRVRSMPRLADCDPPQEREIAAEIDRVTRSSRWVTGSKECRARRLW
jgi:hypothetical protein